MWDVYLQTETGYLFIAAHTSLYRAKAQIVKLGAETDEIYRIEFNDHRLIENITKDRP